MSTKPDFAHEIRRAEFEGPDARTIDALKIVVNDRSKLIAYLEGIDATEGNRYTTAQALLRELETR